MTSTHADASSATRPHSMGKRMRRSGAKARQPISARCPGQHSAKPPASTSVGRSSAGATTVRSSRTRSSGRTARSSISAPCPEAAPASRWTSTTAASSRDSATAKPSLRRFTEPCGPSAGVREIALFGRLPFPRPAADTGSVCLARPRGETTPGDLSRDVVQAARDRCQAARYGVSPMIDRRLGIALLVLLLA